MLNFFLEYEDIGIWVDFWSKFSKPWSLVKTQWCLLFLSLPPISMACGNPKHSQRLLHLRVQYSNLGSKEFPNSRWLLAPRVTCLKLTYPTEKVVPPRSGAQLVALFSHVNLQCYNWPQVEYKLTAIIFKMFSACSSFRFKIHLNLLLSCSFAWTILYWTELRYGFPLGQPAFNCNIFYRWW